MENNNVSRRSFVKKSAVLTIIPSAVLPRRGNTAPSDRLRIAGIGVGGRGGDDLSKARGETIVALCDVDKRRIGRTMNSNPDAKFYKDFRVMLDEIENEIDAVILATPDHTHSVAAMNVLKRKKHLYCEKPLCHSIYETRTITEAAREAGVITQMGNQGHSSNNIRMLCEWIEDGAIGAIREVYAWSDRPVGGRSLVGLSCAGSSERDASRAGGFGLGPLAGTG